MWSAIRTHEVNGQQCEVKKAQSKTDEGMPRSGGGGRGTSALSSSNKIKEIQQYKLGCRCYCSVMQR